MEVLALIPARCGSKSIPRKNIRLFAGHPLIAYSIAAGLQAERVTRVIVSTGDEEIAASARQYGAETPFLRPAEYSRDHTADLPVPARLAMAGEGGYHPEIVVSSTPPRPWRGALSTRCIG
jgi:N-acylneuraminate cytidylyltransferase